MGAPQIPGSGPTRRRLHSGRDKKRCRIYGDAKGSGVLCGEQRVPNNIVLRTRARRLPSDKRAGPSLRKAQPGLLPRWPALAAARRRALAERP